ncbi:lysosomal Pro-X carboxypeptidase-like [Galendromus occidentalis]|uniref:Lysosomal Pro-X carboxypeptidase n=1 Tax=Galendromus occidentalis TaxID=34638 RepID=A0AAJ6W0H8_9ACAR|nr:lysosomal Pro-X carboxypeptidase-like [Galendromus occidentalis]
MTLAHTSALVLFVLTTGVGCDEFSDLSVQYFEQRVDHFGFHKRDTFRQKYLMSDKTFQAGGPIFFYCGGEMNVELHARQTGLMFTWAREFRALVVFAEHRYYGESLPYGDASFYGSERRGYLSTEQALADYAAILSHLKANHTGATKSEIVVWGAGYSGMLAVWMRVKYPHIAKLAYASSAPIGFYSGEVPCGKFLKAVTSVFRSESETCVQSIRRIWNVLQTMATSRDGMAHLADAFNTCQPVRGDNISNLFRWLKESFRTISMLDFPYETDLFGKLPAYPVKEACSKLWNHQQSDRDLMRAAHKAVSVLYNHTGEVVCYSLDNTLRNNAGWGFQACTELIMPVCSDGMDDMFNPKSWDLKKVQRKCLNKFGVWPDDQRLKRIYGGATGLATVDNIVVTNNQRDPWYDGGILTGTEGITVISIRNGAHGHDMRTPHEKDPISVTWARSRVRAVIRRTISPLLNYVLG